MSRIFVDRELLTWEVFESGGDFGLPLRPKVVFLCLSAPDRRARFVQRSGDSAGAQRAITQLSDEALIELLQSSTELP